MDCSWSETMSFDLKKAAEDELIRGRDFAQQLQSLLRKSSSGGFGDDNDDDDDFFAALSASDLENLISSVLNSFSKAISILNSNHYESLSDDMNNNGSVANSPPTSRNVRKSEESGGESSKCSTFKDRRGCYKRRKSVHSWTRESSSLIDDGHAWRKYGQKSILNAKFPRNYFRCTHKYDQGCQATKQVQKMEEDPPKYCTTYYGYHTCTNYLKAASEIVLDGNFNNPSSSSEVLLSFERTAAPVGKIISTAHQRDDHIFTSFPSTTCTVKKEFMRSEENRVGRLGIGAGDDFLHNQHVHVQLSSSSDFNIMSPEQHFGAVVSSSLDQSSEHGGDVLSEVMMGSVVDFDSDGLADFGFL